MFPFELASDETFPSYQELDPTNSLIINLAPIRELMFYYKRNENTFKNCQLAIYGSFNIRSVLLSQVETPILTCEMLESFADVLLYESYYANGEDNSITEQELLYIIKTKHPALIKTIQWWNTTIVDDCRETCQTESPESEKYKRNKKVIDVIEAEPHQFVNADTGLMAVLLAPELQNYAFMGKISFVPKSFYTSFNECDSSKFKLIKCSDGSLKSKQIEIMKQILSKSD